MRCLRILAYRSVLDEAVEGAIELAVVAHFGYVHVGGEAGVWLLDSIGLAFTGAGFLFTTLLQSAGFLLTPDAFLAPVVDGHLLDEQVFDGGLGLEFVAESLQERGELFAGFAFEDYGFGEESVAETVAGGFAFAFGCGGSAGVGAVGAGGGFLFFGFVDWFVDAYGVLFISMCVRGHGG